jgi:Kef-type K+ transport system membrane component KefB
VGAWFGGFKVRSATQIGIGMISRGQVALVLAGAGLAAGMLTSGIFSVWVVVTLVTTLVTPPLPRLAFARQPEPNVEVGLMPVVAD